MVELAGVGLIVGEAVKMSREMTPWRAANPDGHEDGAYPQLLLINHVVEVLFEARIRVTWAVVLLVVGIAAGTWGNFASL